MRYAETKQKLTSINRAGSCALLIMIINDDIYIMNVGDSRALMSLNNGKEIVQVTTDHKPMEKGEWDRITKNGGKIY